MSDDGRVPQLEHLTRFFVDHSCGCHVGVSIDWQPLGPEGVEIVVSCPTCGARHREVFGEEDAAIVQATLPDAGAWQAFIDRIKHLGVN